MSERFPLASGPLGPEEIEAAVRCLRSGHYTMGATVRSFEAALASWTGARHAVMVNSGSSANLLVVDSLLRRLDPARAPLAPGDEVIVPALAWPTTVAPLVQLGLVPVYADVDPETMAIAPESAQSLVSSRTRAVFLLHPLGRACTMAPWIELCARHGLVLLEDACESLGAHDRGRHVGTFGYAGTLSHFYSHHLTTLEGGTILTDDDALVDDLRSARAHGWIRDRSDREVLRAAYPDLDPRFLFVLPGYNVRPGELHAAIGLVQLGRLEQDLQARERLAALVGGWVKESAPWLRLLGADLLGSPPATRADRRHSFMTLPFLIDAAEPRGRAEIQAFFEEAGVDTRPIIAGNFLRHPVSRFGRSRQASRLDGAELLLERGFMIGCPPHPSEQAQETLRRAIASLGA